MSRPAVLVVDRRGRAVETAATIDDRYRTRTASTVDAAVDLAGRCDAVLLDGATRAESDASVVARLRSVTPLPPVALLVRERPDVPLFRSPFADYLRRPVTRTDLLDTVERLLVRGACDRVLRASYATARRLATLETDRETERAEYAALRGRFDRQRARLCEHLGDLETASYDVATRHRRGSAADRTDTSPASHDSDDPATVRLETRRPEVAADETKDRPH
ncbi:HalX domain-containing protein [Salinirubrum litoreum]|uniref:HalX domain-containing protein n=1 Tax=Salinirubrum litoreum TaxID=1126234 RepID=A0ABD5R9J6_9EURY|nr:HalX domain-containing protein [Salinirubrum litoreum]